MKPKHFTPAEFKCQCGKCSGGVKTTLIEMLDDARDMAKVPFVITSGYRCEAHNAAIGASPTSSHTLGLAADIAAPTSHHAFLIMQSLIFCGFRRIGWNQAKKFIHCDIDADKPQRVLFAY